MTVPGKGGVLTALALPVALSGCAGEPTSSSSAADPSASSPSNPPLDSDGAVRILGAEQTAEIKGTDLMVSVIRSQLNLP